VLIVGLAVATVGVAVLRSWEFLAVGALFAGIGAWLIVHSVIDRTASGVSLRRVYVCG
jgi:hypothetical protein